MLKFHKIDRENMFRKSTTIWICNLNSPGLRCKYCGHQFSSKFSIERNRIKCMFITMYFHHNISPRHFFKTFFGFWGRESCSFYSILTPKPLVTAYLEFKQTNIKIFCLWTSNQIDTRVTWTVWIRIDTAFSSCWIDRYHCYHISWLIA